MRVCVYACVGVCVGVFAHACIRERMQTSACNCVSICGGDIRKREKENKSTCMSVRVGGGGSV